MVSEIVTGVEADEINTVNGNNLKCATHDLSDVSGSSFTFGHYDCYDWTFIHMFSVQKELF